MQQFNGAAPPQPALNYSDLANGLDRLIRSTVDVRKQLEVQERALIALANIAVDIAQMHVSINTNPSNIRDQVLELAMLFDQPQQAPPPQQVRYQHPPQHPHPQQQPGVPQPRYAMRDVLNRAEQPVDYGG